MNPKEHKQVIKIFQEFFEKMGFNPEIENCQQDDKTFKVSLRVEEPQVLIGRRGQVLTEAQHLLVKILRKKFQDVVFVDLDINHYKERKLGYLKEMARNLADEAVLQKKEMLLPPMCPYERRIVHMELAERGDVETESQGSEPERRIVIKPAT